MSNHYDSKEAEYLDKQGSELETNLTPGQVVLAHIKQFDEQNRPVVCYMVAGRSFTQAALFTSPIGVDSLNRQVALNFLENNIHKPLILGVVYSPLYDFLTQVSSTTDEVDVNIGGEPTDNPKQDSLSEPEAELNSRSPNSREQNERQNTLPILQEPVVVDGKKVKIEGADQVELRCGEASITLTKNGKILIRGKYLLNRASGVNRIVGGSVQVN